MPLLTDIPAPIHFEFARGSSRPLTMALTLADGSGIYILTGVQLLLAVKVSLDDADGDALLTYDNITQSNIVIVNDVLGLAKILRDPNDLQDRVKFPNNVARFYALKGFPGEDLLAWGRWVVKDSGIGRI